MKTCDCVVFGYSKGEGARASTFGALVVGLYDKEGKPVYVAHVGTGFTDKMLNDLLRQFQTVKTGVATFQVRDIEGVTWLEPNFVCEVIYQVVTTDCRLRMPRFHRLRVDKAPSECTVDQIEGKGKCFSQHTLLRNSLNLEIIKIWGEPVIGLLGNLCTAGYHTYSLNIGRCKRLSSACICCSKNPCLQTCCRLSQPFCDDIVGNQGTEAC